jgi:hypothetical protein
MIEFLDGSFTASSYFGLYTWLYPMFMKVGKYCMYEETASGDELVWDHWQPEIQRGTCWSILPRRSKGAVTMKRSDCS